ncbi:MAG: site-specific integrase [Rudaea sp.]|nr:site-specific integrase [Rudaea sp.]
MTRYNANNERIKRQYFAYLKEAKRQSEPSVDAVAKALNRFEIDTKHRDFKAFHFEQAIAFKRRLAEQKAEKTGTNLSKATLHATLAQLKRFFQWLAGQPGYKRGLRYSDADYFNLSENDTRVATARREQPVATLEQVQHAITSMPATTDIGRRNRALVAFTLLSGARDSAIASIKLKHVDPVARRVYQDAREVRTKFRKNVITYFFPVGDDICRIVTEWISYLREVKLWGNDDPLFPATRVALSAAGQFEASGLDRVHWRSAAPIRVIFRDAFTRVGLPYFNPHSFRNTLVQLGESVCRTPKEFKAWSQNLGHEKVLTTFTSYGEIGSQQQGEVIKALAAPQLEVHAHPDTKRLAKALVHELQAFGAVSNWKDDHATELEQQR